MAETSNELSALLDYFRSRPVRGRWLRLLLLLPPLGALTVFTRRLATLPTGLLGVPPRTVESLMSSFLICWFVTFLFSVVAGFISGRLYRSRPSSA